MEGLSNIQVSGGGPSIHFQSTHTDYSKEQPSVVKVKIQKNPDSICFVFELEIPAGADT